MFKINSEVRSALHINNETKLHYYLKNYVETLLGENPPENDIMSQDIEKILIRPLETKFFGPMQLCSYPSYITYKILERALTYFPDQSALLGNLNRMYWNTSTHLKCLNILRTLFAVLYMKLKPDHYYISTKDGNRQTTLIAEKFIHGFIPFKSVLIIPKIYRPLAMLLFFRKVVGGLDEKEYSEKVASTIEKHNLANLDLLDGTCLRIDSIELKDTTYHFLYSFGSIYSILETLLISEKVNTTNADRFALGSFTQIPYISNLEKMVESLQKLQSSSVETYNSSFPGIRPVVCKELPLIIQDIQGEAAPLPTFPDSVERLQNTYDFEGALIGLSALSLKRPIADQQTKYSPPMRDLVNNYKDRGDFWKYIVSYMNYILSSWEITQYQQSVARIFDISYHLIDPAKTTEYYLNDRYAEYYKQGISDSSAVRGYITRLNPIIDKFTNLALSKSGSKQANYMQGLVKVRF